MSSASKPLHDSVRRAPLGAGPFERPLALEYLSPDRLEAALTQSTGRVLGAIAFAAEAPALASPDFPYAWVDMPVLGASAVFELWTSEQPVTLDHTEGVAGARNDQVLFGCVRIPDPGSLDEATFGTYSRVFDFIDSRGYPHLLRAWNYFSGINGLAEGLERYQRFCRGRHEAFCAKGRVIGHDTPAASALGTRSGPLVVYFIAAKSPGERVENPRQTSAYRYPPQYGPRSPTFSRGMVMKGARGSLLFLSGTAGIVGHETQHVGNAAEQARETIANIRAVMQQVRLSAGAAAKFTFKAYVRHPDDRLVVERSLRAAFGAEPPIVYLQADICRSDLLLEVEGICVAENGDPH